MLLASFSFIIFLRAYPKIRYKCSLLSILVKVCPFAVAITIASTNLTLQIFQMNYGNH